MHHQHFQNYLALALYTLQEKQGIYFDMNTVRKTMHESEGLVLQDNTDMSTYPMPKYAEGKDAVFVGRLRRDESFRNTLNMWVVSDNLRKGAATNAIQIAESLLAKKML